MDPFNSKFILKEKRWLWIDYDKGISIMLVGYGHCLDSLTGHADLSAYPFFNYIGTFLYGFRMPLFFIISGLLVGKSLNKKGLGGYISDRTNNILFPLLVWGFIEISMQILAASYTSFTSNTTIGPSRYLMLLLDPRQTGHFWYLNALFFIGVIYAFVKSVLKLKPVFHVLLGFIFFCISAYLHVNNINAWLLTDVLEYYFFFSLGDLISHVMLDENNIKRFSSWKSFFPLLAVFLTTQYFAAKVNQQPSNLGDDLLEHTMPFFYLFEALVGCTISVNFSFLLQKYKVFTWIRIVGYHSLFVYCMQIIVMTMARIFFMNFLHITYIPALIVLIWASGIVLPIFFYNFCLKYNLWWLYTYKKPVKQVEYLQKTKIFSFRKRVEEAPGI
ncbi:MAG: acyltransferase [Bacteroidetes bacterium]|jgi:fucose 4-O-acetylase-like acetyltransferase|nr:acyltransferase [Bacteroidota bacterium]